MIYLYAFLIGGAICVVGQLLISLTNITPARVLVIFVTLGVILTALGLYEPLVELAGAGATVPAHGLWLFAWQGRYGSGGGGRGIGRVHRRRKRRRRRYNSGDSIWLSRRRDIHAKN